MDVRLLAAALLAATLMPVQSRLAAAQQVPPPTYDARDKPLEISPGSTLRRGEGLGDRIEFTIWQRQRLRGAGTCSSQACPVHFNNEVLFARRSRVSVPASAESIAADAVTTTAQASTIKRTLRRGDRGAEVRRLQDSLRRAGFRVDVDGRLGRGTVGALRKFQSQKGLRADGVAGPQTLRALGV
jgi:hypothetical protein